MITKKLFLSFCFRLSQFSLSIITLKVITSILSLSDYAFLSLLLGFSAFFSLFFINPMGIFFQRFINKVLNEKTAITVINEFLFVTLFISLIVFLSTIFWLNNQKIEVESTFITSLTLAIYFLSLSMNHTIQLFFNMSFREVLAGFLSACQAFFSLILAFIFCINNANTSNWLSGLCLSNFLIFILSYFLLKKNSINNIKVTFKKTNFYFINNKFIKFAIPLSLSTFFYWLFFIGYKFIFNYISGDFEVLAFILIGLLIPNQIWHVVESLISFYYYPKFYKSFDTNQKYEFNNLVNKIFPLFLIVFIFTLFNSNFLLHIFVDQKYYLAKNFLVFGCFFEFMRASFNLFSKAAHITLRPNVIFIPYLIGLLITLIFILIFKNINIFSENIFLFMLCTYSFFIFLAMYIQAKKIFFINPKIDILKVLYYLISLLLINFFINNMYLLGILIIFFTAGYIYYLSKKDLLN